MPDPRERVAVVYHFFAHYRGAVLSELLTRSKRGYFLCADRQDFGSGIKEWDQVEHLESFHKCRCLKIGPIMWQRGLLRLAIRRDISSIIYLGNAAWPATWLSAVIARAMGKRVLFWTHGWIKPERGLKRIWRNTFYRLAHGLLLYGHVAKVIGIDQGFPAERLHVIYNSLDYPQQKAARSRVSLQKLSDVRHRLFGDCDTPIAVCTTRLIPVRRLDLLIEALGRLKHEGHPVYLLLVGDGPEKARLEAIARDLGVRVHFYGACYDEDVIGELMMASNVTVAPGKVGLTAMHSLAFGTPVITHDDPNDQMPEWESIVPGKTGSLFRHSDVASLADAIRHWTSTAVPDEAVRENCYRVLERFYNPAFQRRAIERAVAGRPADDIWWMKEGD